MSALVGWLWVLLAAFVVVALAMAATAVLARRTRRASVVDITWGLACLGVAIVATVVARAQGLGSSWVQWLLVGCTTVWAVRLSGHIGWRSIGHGEDPRYDRLLGGLPIDGAGFRVAVRKVFVTQGLAVLLITLPLQVGSVAQVRWPVVAWVGVLVFAVGLFFEAVGDVQLERYKALPRDSRPAVLDTGLWAWTRHPNYFGDATVWWGLWLIGGLACGWWAALASVIAPVAMTHFLRNVTGAALLEREMMKRPAFVEYAARTAYFVPRPPRRG